MTEMNLIEQLGGYEKAKSIYKNRPQTSTHHFNGKYYENWSIGKWVRFDGDQCVDCKKPDSGSVNLGILGLMLLEYRRQHNIFEVGDLVIDTNYKDSDVQEIKSVNGNRIEVFHKNKSYYFATFIFSFRHATDEEIKEGKRLDVTCTIYNKELKNNDF